MPYVDDPDGTALVCIDVPSLGTDGEALADDILGVGAYRLNSMIGFVHIDPGSSFPSLTSTAYTVLGGSIHVRLVGWVSDRVAVDLLALGVVPGVGVQVDILLL